MTEKAITNVNVAHLVSEGKGIGELQKLGVSPAEIRAAGFTVEQMYVHLGVYRLVEAGFTLSDFNNASILFPLAELAHQFPLSDILQGTKKYTLSELLSCFPPSDLRTIGGFTASDFIALGNVSMTDLGQFGFSEEEITSAMSALPAKTPAVSPLQPQHAATMNVGDTWHIEHKEGCNLVLDVKYNRKSEAEARALLLHPHSENRRGSSYSYDGSGKQCPRCGHLFVLLTKYTSSDGMCGIERGSWICDDPKCGMEKQEDYEGYGTIF